MKHANLNKPYRPSKPQAEVLETKPEVLEKPETPAEVLETKPEVLEKPETPAEVLETKPEVLEKPETPAEVLETTAPVLEKPETPSQGLYQALELRLQAVEPSEAPLPARATREFTHGEVSIYLGIPIHRLRSGNITPAEAARVKTLLESPKIGG
jgi:hypothetical protein